MSVLPRSFNSTKVQLEPGGNEWVFGAYPSFNSTKVQLERPMELQVQPDEYVSIPLRYN